MGFAYRCDKCHQLTENQIVLCPSCALNAKEAGQPDVQQLKAEIAALVTELDGLYLDQDMPKCTVAHYVNKLRQLSAV